MSESYDYVIVGAGSAGCVLANRLSADPAVSVLLIDAGTSGKSMFIAMPRGYGILGQPGNPNQKWYKAGRGRAGRGGNRKPEPWFKGSTIGGSSAVNGMVYVKGAPMDYDGWEANGCPGWGWTKMQACFAELESNDLGEGEGRGTKGPLRVSVHPRRSDLHEALIEAGVQAGLSRVDDVNAPEAVRDGGIGYVQRTIFKGRRQTSATAFLEPARRRPNLKVISGTSARKILFDGTRACGLIVRDAAGDRTITVDRELIISAGALETPKLLQLSGIGPAELLNAFDIPVIADAPDVGQNLREHRYMSFTIRVNKGSDNKGLRWPGLGVSALRYFLFGTGPLSYGVHEVLGLVKTSPDLPHADAQMGISLYSSMLTKKGQEAEKVPGIGIGVVVARPESKGSVQIKSADPDTSPMIDANYFADDQDRIAGIGLIRWVRNYIKQPALAPWMPQEVFPNGGDSDEEILETYIDKGMSTFHVSGTCRMGSDARAVVDPELHVKGVTGLRVCDTSIFPTLITGNTNGAAMATAIRLAQIMGV
jgi:choline dehydrogenase